MPEGLSVLGKQPRMGRGGLLVHPFHGGTFFLLCPWVCSSGGQQHIYTLKNKSRKVVEKRNPSICGNLLEKSVYQAGFSCTWPFACVEICSRSAISDPL